jgi:hypothetical protein
MAERITYQVSIKPGRNTMETATLEGATDDDLVISDTNVVALRRFVRQLANGVTVTDVVTAIDAAAISAYPIPTI